MKKVQFVAEWYKTFISHTNEKDVLVNTILDLIKGKNLKSCLEIGLGISPYFAQILAPYFPEYLIVEKRLHKGTLPKNVKLINADWEAAVLKNKFDVIIASHVIYYFDNKKKAIQKIIQSLNPGGTIFFVVNGKTADYGTLKLAFSKLLGKKYQFTYDELLKVIKDRKYREYTVPSTLKYQNPEELYNTLKISFDAWPKEYQIFKKEVINYLGSQLKSNKFIIDQKIIEFIN